ncbi:lectin like domain-containing protein, partial [Sulfurovum sp.]|uniref:lectin like domain-containing protein n=1 Tax=Sulfurovum sp. TaxID=1969726 RepID=UPI0025EC573B
SSSSPIKRGWHTVKLTQPVSVVSGQSLIVQVKFSTPSGYSLPIEGDVSGYVDATYAPGESFWSSDGTNFQDVSDMMTDYIGDPNIAIKVLADEDQPGPVPSHTTLVPVLSYLLF